MIYYGTRPEEDGTGWYLVVLGQYRAVLGSTWWKRLVLGGTGSVWGGTGWYLVVLGQYSAQLADKLWYWVRRRQYWLVIGGTESV